MVYVVQYPARKKSPVNYDTGCSPMKLANMNIVVSGAAGLLGTELVKRLLENGAKVLMLDTNSTSLEKLSIEIQEKHPRSFEAAECDVSDEGQIKEAIERFENVYGHLRGAINNASINPKVEDGVSNFTNMETFSLLQWNREISIGLTGALFLSKLTAKSIIENSSSGAILNVASHFSVAAPNHSLYEIEGLPDTMQPKKPVSYSVVKHGLIGLTKYLATYYAENNIRVNAISPGGIFNDQSPSFVSKYSKNVPLGRMAQKEEVANAAIFLLSEESSYITGSNLLVDGGRTIW